ARCDRKRIRRWLVALSEKELSEATKARQMASVGGMFQYLVYEGLLNKNPMDGVPRPAQDKSRRLVIYLTEEQVEHLLDEIPGGRGLSKREMSYNAKLWPRDRALIVTMLYQGLR